VSVVHSVTITLSNWSNLEFCISNCTYNLDNRRTTVYRATSESSFIRISSAFGYMELSIKTTCIIINDLNLVQCHIYLLSVCKHIHLLVCKHAQIYFFLRYSYASYCMSHSLLSVIYQYKSFKVCTQPHPLTVNVSCCLVHNFYYRWLIIFKYILVTWTGNFLLLLIKC